MFKNEKSDYSKLRTNEHSAGRVRLQRTLLPNEIKKINEQSAGRKKSEN